jgi:hypothetical protein
LIWCIFYHCWERVGTGDTVIESNKSHAHVIGSSGHFLRDNSAGNSSRNGEEINRSCFIFLSPHLF